MGSEHRLSHCGSYSSTHSDKHWDNMACPRARLEAHSSQLPPGSARSHDPSSHPPKDKPRRGALSFTCRFIFSRGSLAPGGQGALQAEGSGLLPVLPASVIGCWVGLLHASVSPL